MIWPLKSGAFLLVLLYTSSLTLSQFLPPPSPRRLGAGIQRGGGYTNSRSRNDFFSLINRRSYVRTNFQDLFSYNGDKLEWFEVLETADCSPIPATVNAGRPPRDICRDAAVAERRCICVNTGRGRFDSGYEMICGECRDPCQLKFTPDRVSRRVEELAFDTDGNF